MREENNQPFQSEQETPDNYQRLYWIHRLFSPVGLGVSRRQVLSELENTLLKDGKNAFKRTDEKKDKAQMMVEALEHYLTSQTVTPSSKVLHRIALISLALGHNEKALSYIDDALSMAPISATLYHNRGVIRKKLGQNPGALADFNKAIQLDQEDTADDGLIQKIKRYIMLKPKAGKVKTNPKDPYTHNLRGEVFFKEGDYSHAKEDFLSAINESDDKTRGRWGFFNNYGRVVFELAKITSNHETQAKMLEEARKNFEKAKELNPHRPEPYFYRAQLLTYLDSKTPEPFFEKHVFGSLLFASCYCDELIRNQGHNEELTSLASQIKEEQTQFAKQYPAYQYK